MFRKSTTWILFAYLFVTTAGWVMLWQRLTETEDDRATAESLNMTGTATAVVGIAAIVAGTLCATILTWLNSWLVKRQLKTNHPESGRVFGLMVASCTALQAPVIGFHALVQDFGGFGFSVVQIVLWVVGSGLYTQNRLRL